jgi:hypothetical protein
MNKQSYKKKALEHGDFQTVKQFNTKSIELAVTRLSFMDGSGQIE